MSVFTDSSQGKDQSVCHSLGGEREMEQEKKKRTLGKTNVGY